MMSTKVCEIPSELVTGTGPASAPADDDDDADGLDSAYVFVGGLPYELTEGDVLTVFSQ
jgi:RNA recognition motif-containing protein